MGFGIRKLAQGIRNPLNYLIPESKFHWHGIRNPVPGIQNPRCEIQNLSSTDWNPGARFSKDPENFRARKEILKLKPVT